VQHANAFVQPAHSCVRLYGATWTEHKYGPLFAVFAPGPPTTASHIELSPCGKFAYVSNRVGVDIDGGCAACAEGAISVISVRVRVPSVPYPDSLCSLCADDR
jgi:hypothetical protein